MSTITIKVMKCMGKRQDGTYDTDCNRLYVYPLEQGCPNGHLPGKETERIEVPAEVLASILMQMEKRPA